MYDARLDGNKSAMTGALSLYEIVEPLVTAPAFRRLYDATFLGILSPKYDWLPGHPLARRIEGGEVRTRDDGSRAEHSLGVAKLMLRFVEKFQLSLQATRYAVAWALTHDIATWPLSHTGEAAFSRATGTDHRTLRRDMILGSATIPTELHLDRYLEQMGVQGTYLFQLFDKTSIPFDSELRALHSVIHSAITPDTLEGIYRSGRAIGMSIPEPSQVLDSIEEAETPDLFSSAIVRKERSIPVLKFWRSKAFVYDRYINSQAAIEFESRWTSAIAARFDGVSLLQSLYLGEETIIREVFRSGLPSFEFVDRYKPPQRYELDRSLKHQSKLRGDSHLDALRNLLVHNKK